MQIEYNESSKNKNIKQFHLPECIKSNENYWLRANLSNGDAVIISGARNSLIKIHDLFTSKCLKTFDISDDKTHLSSFMLNKDEFFCGTGEGTLKILNSQMKFVKTLTPPHFANISCLLVIANKNQLVSASDDDTLKIWNLNTNECLQTLEGHSTYVRAILYASNTDRLISASMEIKIWNMSTYQCERTIQLEFGFSSFIRCMSLLKSENEFAVGSQDHTIHVWNMNEFKCELKLKGHTKYVRCLLFIRDLNVLVSGADDSTIKVWNLEKSDKCLRTLRGHTKCVNCLIMLPLFNEIVSGSSDGSLRIWNIVAGRCLKIIQCHNDSVRGLILHRFKLEEF